MEDVLGKLEGFAAKIVSTIIHSNCLPARHSEDHHWLLLFVLIQKARTVYAADEMNETAEQMGRILMSHDERFTGLEDNHRIQFSDPALMSVKMAIETRVLAHDLHCKLLLNTTANPFVTSDNPVVCYNQLMESKRAFGSSTGLQSKGLQLFIPLSPRHCLMYYDSQAYNVGSLQNPVVRLARTEDVDSLNLLQMINATENVYFGVAPSEEELVALAGRAAPHRSKPIANTTKCVNSENSDSYLYVHTRREVRCGLKLTPIQTLRTAKEYALGNKAVHVRDEKLCRWFNDFSDQVTQGKYRPDEFPVFMSEKIFEGSAEN